MPVDIVGSASFAGQVLAQLRVICPCRPLSVGAGQRVVLGASDACACAFPAGTLLVERLVEGDRLLRIQGPCCNSSYSPRQKKIYLCPDQRLPSCFDEPAAPPAVTLAHELIHAWVDLYRPDLPNDEASTSRAENQIRREHGWAPRCCYGADRVGMEGGYLPDSWTPVDPSCPPDDGDWAADVRRALWTIRWTAEIDLRTALGCGPCGESGAPAAVGSDEGGSPESSPVDAPIRRGREYRSGLALAAVVDRVVDGFRPGPGRLVHLERIVVDGGFRVLVIHLEGDTATVVTNVGVDPAGSRLVPLGGLFRYRFALDDAWAPSLPVFRAGNGGDAGVFDGATSVLEVSDGSNPAREMALYGLHHAVDPCASDPPDDPVDRERWEAVAETWALWVELSRRTPESVEPV